MPFIQLNHSKNLQLSDKEYNVMFRKINEVINTHLGSVKSMKITVNIPHYSFIMENNSETNSFIFLRIAILKKADRTDEVKDKIGKAVLSIIDETFHEKLSQNGIKIFPSVEIAEVLNLYKNY